MAMHDAFDERPIMSPDDGADRQGDAAVSSGNPGAESGAAFTPTEPAAGGPAHGGGGHGGRGRRPMRWAAGIAALALLAGSAGAGIVLAYNHWHPNNTVAVARPVTPQRLQAVSSTKLNASALAAKVEPAVVDITVTLADGNGSAAGTGMILTPSGEVLTNNHVVEGASTIEVKIPGHAGRYSARVLGVDPTRDVALLQINGVSGLPTVTLSGTPPYVGEQVVAIGNALDLKGAPTVTEGTITALNRSITATNDLGGNSENLVGMLQTDAALAPGDSGGPLINVLGQVVGMDTAAYSGGATPRFTDVGFAIPIKTALGIVRQIQAGHASSTVLIGTRPVMGVGVINAAAAQADPFAFQLQPATNSGALVVQVNPGSPAAGAGMVPGDVIVGFDGQTITSITQLSRIEAGLKVGQTVSVTWVTPAGQSETASVQLVPGPPA